MNYLLEPYHRNTTEKELLDDLVRVAKLLNTQTLTKNQYEEYGNYHSTTFHRRFGSWLNAIEKAGLDAQRKNKKISEKDLIKDLKKVAKKLHQDSVSVADYVKYGNYSSSSVSQRFGSWNNSLKASGLKIAKFSKIEDEDLFRNIEEIWQHKGKQPRYSDISKPYSKYSSGTYEKRFGSWRKALEAFSEFMNSEEKEQKSFEKKLHKIDTTKNNRAFEHKTKRNISWRLRFLVMRRDNFKCVIDGRSPATHNSITLEVDHIIPWSKGGETVIDNLQTLCSICNSGKSNLNMYEK
ncbi:MAG: HNH endonuclease [Bacteroidetes bacterium]|nr:HNH endonuclease [Bacteroidota bacterium]